MSSSLTFQDNWLSLAQSQQEPPLIPEENPSDQKSTQNYNQREDHEHNLEDEEESISPASPPGSPNEQQHSSLNDESTTNPDLNLNPPPCKMMKSSWLHFPPMK